MKGISANNHVTEFVLYDCGKRDQVLHYILGRLSTDVQSQFTTGERTDEYGICQYGTYPCIRLSTSGEYRQYYCCLLQPSVPLIAILWVLTFELVCAQYTFTSVLVVGMDVCMYMWVWCVSGCIWSLRGFTAGSIYTTRSHLGSAQTQCNLPR